jgi:hypothetical protein
MKAVFLRTGFLRSGALVLAAALAGCTAQWGGGPRVATEATRFHLGDPIARGPIAVEPADPRDSQSPEFRTYADIVARQLGRLGWTVTPGLTSSEQVAVVNVQRATRETYKRPPVTIGVGGATGGWRSGVGVGGAFGIGGGRRELVATLLEVRIKRRSDGTVFWEGRADTQAPAASPEAQSQAAVEKLAALLFQDFPGESGRTISGR